MKSNKAIKLKTGLLMALSLSVVTSTSGLNLVMGADIDEALVKDGDLIDTTFEQSAKRPNLLFIMSDQHRYDALGIAGNTVVSTPNIDGIGQNGVYFETAYTHVPVCVPTRTSLLTGHTIDNTKIRKNADVSAKEEDGVIPMKTFSEILAEQGYYSEYNGKWHIPQFKFAPYTEIGLETELGTFKDYNKFLNAFVPTREPEMGEQVENTYNRPYRTNPMDRRHGLAPGEIPLDDKGKTFKLNQPDAHGELLIPSEYTKVAFDAKTTIQSLKRAKENEEPFSIVCSFGPPHSPTLPTSPYYGMYPADEMTPSASIHDPMDNTPYINGNRRLSLTEYADEEKIKYMISDYYGMVTEIDDWIGQIIETLKEIGEYENTLIIYTSDHGEMLGAHGMREKNNFYEEFVHVPLVISYPGKIEPGTVVKNPVSWLDLFPTILDYLEAGSYNSDGESLRPLIEGTSERRYVVSQWNIAPDFCVRADQWKLIYSKEEGPIDCLYNLEEDPHEMNNLIGENPERMKYEEKVEELKSYLTEYLERTNSPYVDIIKNKPAISIPKNK